MSKLTWFIGGTVVGVLGALATACALSNDATEEACLVDKNIDSLGHVMEDAEAAISKLCKDGDVGDDLAYFDDISGAASPA